MEPRRMFGFTREQWMDPARLLAEAEKEWNAHFAREEAFDLVKNKDHWKGPIDAIIAVEDKVKVQGAIVHYTGGGTRFTPLSDGRLRVTAPGYWANGF